MQLKRHDFPAGFENYLRRWDTQKYSFMPLRDLLPRVKPKEFFGRILLWAEQGLGDEIFYASMIQKVQSRSSKITLAADKRLHSIFRRSFPMVDLINRDQTPTEELKARFDTQAPIGDLGYLLRLNKVRINASRKPFLTPDRDKVSHLKLQQPFTRGEMVCGLSWRSTNKEFGHAKSVHLDLLASLIKNHRLHFVNLQYGDVNYEIRQAETKNDVKIYQIEDLDLFNDIDGLLALIQACDYVITASNVTAHLAGAIGKRGCILVPYSKGKIWYWHLHDEYSLWYPTLRVFYQSDPNDWSQTIERAVNWVGEIC